MWYFKKINRLRFVINNLPATERDRLARTYIIPFINILFDKNYPNLAQYALLACEEWFLSFKTDAEFETVLALFSQHAIDCGLRFRRKFPLRTRGSDDGMKTVAFTSYWTSNMSTETVMNLCSYLSSFKKKFISLKCYDDRTAKSSDLLCKENGVQLILPKKECHYDVFTLRRLFEENDVDMVFWIMPPFHMFFYYAFGLAPKQVWFSLYLHPNIKMPHLHGYLTVGGCGYSTIKKFNGRMWDIVPQASKFPYECNIPEDRGMTVLYCPARLEKFKQPDFFNAILNIMKQCPNTVIKWTGYTKDKEVIELFIKNGLAKRHRYVAWQTSESLIAEIRTSDIILASFPLGLGVTEMLAAIMHKPIVTMYDEEKSQFWRDCYFEALNDEPELQKICLDSNGNSKIKQIKTVDEYVQYACDLINSPDLQILNSMIYSQAYNYTYINNKYDLKNTFENFYEKISNKI